MLLYLLANQSLAMLLNCFITGFRAERTEIESRSESSGLFLLLGEYYCSRPDLISWLPDQRSGVFQQTFKTSISIVSGLWASALLACFFLILTRLLEILVPSSMKLLFTGYQKLEKPRKKMVSGHRTFLWLAITFFYGLSLFLFERPVLFDSQSAAWIYDPRINGSNASVRLSF